MSLGKTIEALAALGHLYAEGETHSLVVCPASVLVNWEHEVRRHSRLKPHRIHGGDRDRNLAVWARLERRFGPWRWHLWYQSLRPQCQGPKQQP